MQQKLDKLLNTIAETSGDLLIMIEQNPDGPYISEIRAIHEAGRKIKANVQGLFRDIDRYRAGEYRRTGFHIYHTTAIEVGC